MKPELTLDPDDWDAFAALAHDMVDATVRHLRTLRERPAWQPVPDAVRARLDAPVPRVGIGERAAWEAFEEDVRPFTNGNLDPRFLGWVQGNGTPLGMMADMLAASINPHMAGFDQAPALVEARVVEWLRELMGFPPGSSGLLLSGGSMAGLTGLCVARHAVCARHGIDDRANGLAGGPQLVVYGSTETHAWAAKTCEVLGLGRRGWRTVPTVADQIVAKASSLRASGLAPARAPVDTPRAACSTYPTEHQSEAVVPPFRDGLDVDALRSAIAADRAAGHLPMAVVGTAGTVNTGATDDLHALADLCAAEGLWLHVDGAFGALAALSPTLRDRVAGLERADSLSFDLHKWMYLPFEIACLLVRDGDAHRATFAGGASYIATLDRGVIAGGLPFANLGIELTRGFKALKAWMSLQAYGVDHFATLIEQNVAQAAWLADRVDAEPRLARPSPGRPPLNVVCFRFVDPDLDDAALDALNIELLLQLQEQGVAVPSSTVLAGRFWLRCCIVNHRLRRDDLEALIAHTVRIGEALARR